MVDVHHMVTFHQIKNYKYGGHTLFLKVFLWWMATIKNMTMVEIHHIFCDSYKVNYCQLKTQSRSLTRLTFFSHCWPVCVIASLSNLKKRRIVLCQGESICSEEKEKIGFILSGNCNSLPFEKY